MYSLRRGHSVQLLQSGAEFFPALIGAIDASTREVRLETYIFHFDATGTRVAQALEAAALRGVAVYLVMDGVGTPRVPPEWVQRFDDAGVAWHQFSPLGTLGLLIPGRWRRLHRKLCVVDEEVLFCGGINIIDDLFELSHGAQTTPRFDFAVRVTGPLVADAQATMLQLWQHLPGRQRLQRWVMAAGKRLQRAIATKTGNRHADAGSAPKATVAAALVLRDNWLHRRRIERAYLRAIAHARKEVIISNAYFLPGAKLRRALVHAVRRGVRVRLLLQGKYEYFMQFHTAKAFYQYFTGAGVEIYEYHTGFLHAKVAVIDGRWATVGSSNLDPLSLLLAREANVVVEDAHFAQGLCTTLDQAIATQSVQIEPQMLSKRSVYQRGKDLLAWTLMRLSLFLTGRSY